MIPRVADWAPDIRFVLQKSLTVSLRENYRTLRSAVGRRIGMPMNRWDGVADRLDARELAESGCDIVFSHRGFPVNSGDVPVVWMNGLPDPEMVKSYSGFGQAEIDEEIAVKGVLLRKAAAVQLCTEAEVARHARTFPDIAERFVAVSLFAPDLHSIPESRIEKHRKARPVRLLFVGNQPRLKGLPETLEAYASLPDAIRRFTSLTVVSHFDGDRHGVAIPDDPRITVHRGLRQPQVLELMRDSHILVNVSRSESFRHGLSRGHVARNALPGSRLGKCSERSSTRVAQG